MAGMLLIGIPMYICATASTPVAAAMLVSGVSPGTVLVFLLAGPATNFAGLSIVRRELGWHALGSYLVAICGVSIGLGLLTDLFVQWADYNIVAQPSMVSHLVPDWVAISSAIILIVLIGVAWCGQWTAKTQSLASG